MCENDQSKLFALIASEACVCSVSNVCTVAFSSTFIYIKVYVGLNAINPFFALNLNPVFLFVLSLCCVCDLQGGTGGGTREA